MMRKAGCASLSRPTVHGFRVISQDGASMTRVGGSDGARDSTPILAAGSDIYRKLW